ncbi:MAG TPA: sugar transferase [Candidatus Coatesbacteria bacterium]|nr:sugar transferase [Candidatus Coatesbacteria bacterium]
MRVIMKRVLDLVVAAAGLVVISPVMGLTAVAIALGSPGSVLFRQSRVGRHGRIFKMYKFRTMVAGAEENGGGITSAGDPRITPVGAFLRSWKLDELPNLFNVLKGEMSLVGPRPELPCYLEGLDERQRRILELRPGITGLAQLRYINESLVLSPEQVEREYGWILAQKIDLDLTYLERADALYDLKLIFTTLFRLLRGDSAKPGLSEAPGLVGSPKTAN